jgi:hypothetical protein
MIFYHYTCGQHLPKIMKDRFLKTTESNVSMLQPRSGPDVVWLFKKPLSNKVCKMLQTVGGVDKSRIQFTVDLPRDEVLRSDKFFKKHKADKHWIKMLEEVGGSRSKDWYVIDRRIPSTEWAEVYDREDKMLVCDRN